MQPTIITPTQSREARRELGLSQADAASAVGLNRAYLSDYESGNLNRFTKSQLRKLRSHYEEKIAAARDAGDEIEITFGDAEPEVLAIRVEAVSAQQCTFPIGKEVSEEVISATLATISNIDKKLVSLLSTAAKREEAFFSPGEFNEETLAAFRESFSLLACNYLLIRSIGGWPEIGLSAANMNIGGNSVLAEVIANVSDYFKEAGLIGDPEQKTNEPAEVEA